MRVWVLLALVAMCVALQRVGDISQCPQLSAHDYPENVTAVRPDDIRVMMALGDSISAGFAMHADPAITGFREFRGDVFSIGGDAGQPTIFNYMKHFSPNVVGASEGVSSFLDVVWFKNFSIIPHEPKIDHLNGAQSNGRVEHLFEQAQYVHKTMQEQYPQVTDDDWKMMTVLITANDLCVICQNAPHSQPEFIRESLNVTLNYIRSAFKRIIINILPMVDITQVATLSHKGDFCYYTHELLGECPCVWESDATRADIVKTNAIYTQIFQDAADEWNNVYNDFAIVLQPFASQTKFDRSLISNLDCFHPNSVADKMMSVGLWNNLLQKGSQKQTSTSPEDTLMCPENDSFIWVPAAGEA